MRHAVRTSTLVALLALAGCAAPPRLVLVEVRVPAPDPYLVRPEGDFPPVAEIHAPRPRDWLPDRHLEDIAALSTVVRVTPDRGTSLVTGPEGAAEVVALFLVDRARHERARVLVNAYQVDVAPDALAFEALTPCSGGLYAHVPARVALGLVPAPRHPTLRFISHDDEEVELKVLEQRAHVAGCVKVMGAGGHVVTDPIVETVTCGDRVTARAWLSGGAGDVLVLDWRQEATRASLDRDAEVAVRNEGGFTAVPVSIPRLHDTSLATRVVLRRGEALVLVQAPPDQEELRLTIVTWTTSPTG